MDTTGTSLHGLRIAALLTDGFEQVEYTGPRDALEGAGVTTKLISEHAGKVQGFRHHDKDQQFDVDITFNNVSAEDFDGVLLPAA